MSEKSLADVVEVVESALPAPEDFDFDAFLAGARPVRRAVRIYAKGHLVGEMERIVDALERDPDNADLAAEAERLYAEWDAASVVVTVEKRTSEWVDAFKAESIRTHKIKTGKGGQPLDDADTRRIVLHQLAEQIVSPQLTYDHLEGLYQVAEGEVSKLIVAMNLANNALPETAAVVTAGFSHGRSAAAQA